MGAPVVLYRGAKRSESGPTAKGPGAQLNLLRHNLTEEALGTEEEGQHQDEKHDRVLVCRGDVCSRKDLEDANRQAAEEGTRDASKSTDDDADPRLEDDRQPHLGRDEEDGH